MIRKSILFCSACLLLCGQASAQNLEGLVGNWKMVASPFEGGSEEIAFTTTVATDGTSLDCHAEQLMVRGASIYAADWKIAVEQNGENIRLGWALDSDNPVSTKEFQEPASSYALFGKDTDGNHRYIYLLSENIETQQLEAMTLWSDWQTVGSTTFALPKTQQIYAVVSTNQPYNGSVGYAEIWASAKLQKVTDTGIETIHHSPVTVSKSIYNLQGMRLNQLQKGLNIVNGKKVVVKTLSD
jgi:hypothetical protein